VLDGKTGNIFLTKEYAEFVVFSIFDESELASGVTMQRKDRRGQLLPGTADKGRKKADTKWAYDLTSDHKNDSA